MEVEGQATETSESTESVQPDGAPAESSSTEATEGEPQTPAYQPSYKFKVKDKELEFDPRFHSIVKSKEDEEFLRDLHTKAHGLDDVKSSKETLEQEYQTYRASQEQEALKLKRFFGLRQHNLGAFIEQAKITDDQLIEYLNAKFDPEVAQSPHYQKASQLSNDHYQLANQHEDLTSQYQRIAQENHQIKLTQAIASPDVAEFARRVDAKGGIGGQKFTDLVHQTGAMLWERGQKLEPAQVCQMVMQTYGQFFPKDIPTSTTTTPQEERSQPATIPNLGGGSHVAPVKKAYRSIDELRKLQASMG